MLIILSNAKILKRKFSGSLSGSPYLPSPFPKPWKELFTATTATPLLFTCSTHPNADSCFHGFPALIFTLSAHPCPLTLHLENVGHVSLLQLSPTTSAASLFTKSSLPDF